MSGLPTAAPGTLAAAAVFAVHQVLCKVYPSRINDFDVALNASLEQLGAPSGEPEETLGRDVANLIIDQRTSDGSEHPHGRAKKGKTTDYVERQYISNIGKVDRDMVSVNAYRIRGDLTLLYCPLTVLG